ncbi:carboxylesterase [Bifidobacterium lemurum]|uniref:Carboxylic ester hydrolase n=1 Tax=Bifidobacterium lemurum TaxID=1603886 RepID=A0A261FV68_9BIFI|nr:carboxylesterase family protein [Bifidobacterium lemurum]OZG62646.1 carboxylesterase [Bifidobacterium lemurum]QOL34632.1 carboxylesterase family protein [Bifidobacterium lemurum]
MVIRLVRTGCGPVEGLAESDPCVTVFRGVPFAAPPVGNLRWKPPQPVSPWREVRCAHTFAPMAMQPLGSPDDFYGKEWQMDADAPMSEDCLYLNIWTPSLRGVGDQTRVVPTANAKGLPVMVWIHGGAFQCGSVAEKEFDGYQLARRGVVVVSLAYRLNVFGFFSHADLEMEVRDERLGDACANFGFLDQRMGIQWVHDNIAAFGGDPANITVFGQSAGGASVLAQMCSPMRRGLFDRAIIQSSGGVGVFNAHIWSLEEAQRNGERFLRHLGVGSLDEARAIPARDVLAAAESLSSPEGSNGGWPMVENWIPCVDGRFLTDQYAKTIESGACVDVDLLFGNTTNEFNEERDGVFVAAGEEGNRELGRLWVEAGGKEPFYYRFDVPMPGDDAGAFHSSDLWFSFGTLSKCWRPFVGWHYDLARMMCSYWANFALSGDPNGSDMDGDPLPQWEKSTTDSMGPMVFSKTLSVGSKRHV